MDPNAVFVQCGPVPLDGTHQQSNAPPPPHPHRPAPHLPNLPFEVIRRIIHHRLALPDSVPEAVPSISAFTESNDQCEGSSARPGYAASRTVQWDDLAGHAGRQAAKASRRERREVMRDAAGMMLVCKAWKPIVMRYLYHSPPLTSSSLLLLTESVLRGDKKWDDTRLHPHSIPGRYVRTLDLSDISLSMTDFGYDFDDQPPPHSSDASTRSGANAGAVSHARVRGPAPHVTALARACAALMPLLPNVTHVKMPQVGGGAAYEAILGTIRRAPFVRNLRAVEGLHVPGGTVRFVPTVEGNSHRRAWAVGDVEGESDEPDLSGARGDMRPQEPPTMCLEWREGEALLDMLSKMPKVEYLSFTGAGLGADTWPTGPLPTSLSFSDPSSLPFLLPSLHLPSLHTLKLDSLPTSPLLAILSSSPLPSLSRLFFTSYTPLPPDFPSLSLSPLPANLDLSLDMLASHGPKLLSLTLLPTREWPPVHPLPPDHVFERYCHCLRHVSLLLPLAAYVADKEGAARLGRVMGRRGGTVECVTLAKWAQRSGGSPSPSPHGALAGLPPGPPGPPGSTGVEGQLGADMNGLAIHDITPNTANGQTGARKIPPLPRTHPLLHALISSAFQAASSSAELAHTHDSGYDDTLTHRCSALRSITIDGLTSVSPHLSFAARDAGANGEMRAWAIGMAMRGFEMLDGAKQPVLAEYHHHTLTGIPETYTYTFGSSSAAMPAPGAASGSRIGPSGSPISNGYTIGQHGSFGAASIGSLGDMSPIAAAAAAGAVGMNLGVGAGMGMAMRRSSAGEWDGRGRRRSRGGVMPGGGAGMGGMSVFGGYAAVGGRRDRGADDDDGG